jgi:HPt (histidine-containing phosphotransfer) domain-containing protein
VELIDFPAEVPPTEGRLDRAALKKLLELVGGEQALLAELIDSFLQDTPPLLASMRRALEQGDPAQLGLAAHTLKSTSRGFGAMRLSEWCVELEAMGNAGTLDGAAELVTQLEKEYQQVSRALEIGRDAEGAGHEP